MCYESDEALFFARLRPFSAYSATRGGKFAVVGIKDTANHDYMIITSGSKSEDAAFSAAGRSGGTLERIEQEMLTEAERMLIHPVHAYSNFAQPNCALTSLTGFNRCLSAMKSGRYAVVSVPAD